MSTSFHVRVRQILESSLQQDPTTRASFIRRACAGDATLLEEVTSLLPHYEQIGDFQPQPPRGVTWQCPGDSTFGRARQRAAQADSSDAEPALPFRTGDYTLVEVLGRGGMGIVYHAVNRVTGRQVAIKVLRAGLESEEDRRRFAWEAEVLRQLHHPSIARIIHTGIIRLMRRRAVETIYQHRPYIVMEYVSGRPLLEFARTSRLDLRHRLSLFAAVCDAVGYAHRRGIIHRDLKPDNILVERSGRPKVLDFGICRVVALQSRLFDEERGRFAGTLAYASPEQLAGDNEHVTSGCDVYSLALVGHELLTAELPPRCGTRVSLKLERMSVDDDVARSGLEAKVRRALGAIFRTALRQSPGKPYDTAAELGADIESLLAQFPARSRWSRLKAILSGALSAHSAADPGGMPRPLSAVLRQRIAMAVESQEHRARLAQKPPADHPS